MRIVYPTLSASEYLGILKAGSEREKTEGPERERLQRKKNMHILGFLMCLSFAGILFILSGLSALWAIIITGIAVLVCVVITIVLFISKGRVKSQNYAVQKPDLELLDYYSMCDSIRLAGIHDVAIHVVDNSCTLDFSYIKNGEVVRKSLDMSWRVSENVNDTLIDFERRSVTVPKDLCNSLVKGDN